MFKWNKDFLYRLWNSYHTKKVQELESSNSTAEKYMYVQSVRKSTQSNIYILKLKQWILYEMFTWWTNKDYIGR